ncbi:uncharacterized protein TNIN_266471 [Trichonephila inaurata madagascariensis]|uniref:Uncharacterized protein n=1 Tax=Trichonephila inaurata madagascariensis TaxID=2747483 RepID=A0A8X6Y4Q8_9ARAC|nr:uncharacterized protein TNIN_266471 [Trichonephila inaurata madagascariensis]
MKEIYELSLQHYEQTRYFSSPEHRRGQTLKDLDIEICRDNVHLCPGTTECCKGEDGRKYDCCPKASVPIAGRGTVATNWDLSGLAVPLLYLNAIGGDAGWT